MGSSALVLGAGGITGIAWQLGTLVGLRGAGVDLTTADLIVGTSAGAVTGALVAAGIDPARAAVIDAPLGLGDPPMQPDWVRGAEAFALLNDPELEPTAMGAAIGALAVAAQVGTQDALVASFARRLPITDWPARLLVTAVDTADGTLVVWDHSSDAPLVRAVTASCAVPCLFPPVTVNGRRYMDGGVRSRTNADLADGHDPVVVVAPLAPVRMSAGLDGELARLRTRARVTLVAPDELALAALGGNVFDASRWQVAVDAGIAQGARLAGTVGEGWWS